jgi:hypothetical protein
MRKPLFHWSPTARRNQINRRGLVPGSRSVDGLWKPPFVCFADSPSLAWALSGQTSRGQAIKSWDLWQMWSDVPTGLEELLFDDDPGRIKEYRVYERIYKRDLWYVATRWN